MSKWSEELKEKTRTELFPSAMVKDEEHNYGIVTEIEPKIVIKGVVNGGFMPMPSEETIKREFEAFKPIKDSSPKYVLSLDKIDLSHDGITHINIEDFLMHKKDLFLA